MKKFLMGMFFLLMVSAQASAMNLTFNRDVDYSISLGREPFTLKINGGELLEGDYSKGVVLFNGDLYFHFDATLFRDKLPQAKTRDEEQRIFDAASRFGSSDFANAVPVFTFEGRTQIFPIKSDDEHKFYLLATETGGGGFIKVIGERGGKWVKYFDTFDMRKQIPREYYLENFYTDDDTVIFLYKEWQKKNYCTLCYKWDESEQWFNVEIIY